MTTLARFLNAVLADPEGIDPDRCLDWPFYRDKDDYGQLTWQGRSTRAHVLTCEALHGPRPEGKYAAHNCGRSCCVNPHHIRWATNSENQMDRVKHGTSNRGSRHGHSKLTEAQAIEVMRLVREGKRKQAAIAADFGISPSLISKMKSGDAWAWLHEGSPEMAGTGWDRIAADINKATGVPVHGSTLVNWFPEVKS